MNRILQQLIIILTLLLVVVICYKTAKLPVKFIPPVVIEAPPPTVMQEATIPIIPNQIPKYENYSGIGTQLVEWAQQAPDFAEFGFYGKSTQGRNLCYLRVTNRFKTGTKLRVLITACIHGNEPLSTSTVMGYIGTMLGTYGTDPQVKEILDTREIYFIPVISPDSYPNDRYVDGVDPNRNFLKNPSVPPIEALKQFFLKIQPQAVISGHTSGRVLLYPYGYTYAPTPNDADFKAVVGQMARMCDYRYQPACQMYARPFSGSEGDWFYDHGAFPIVLEFGTHQRIPSLKDTQVEFQRTYKGVLYFIQEAPKVQIKKDYWLVAA